MSRVKQISVFMENRLGAVGEVLHAFTKSGVNLRGLSVSDTVDHAVVRMVVSDTAKAIALLEGANMLCLEHEVLEVKVDDEPGAFAKLAERLAGEKINIHYAYGSTPNGGQATLYVRVSDTEKAVKLLSGANKK